MRGRRSVPVRIGALESETARRSQRAVQRMRPDLSRLSDAELESLLPLAERAAAPGADLVLGSEEQAMVDVLLPRVRWRTS